MIDPIFSRIWLSVAEKHEAHYASGDVLCDPFAANKALSIGIKVLADIPRYLALAAKLRARGYLVRPFILLCNFVVYSDWWNPAWWAAKREMVAALFACNEWAIDLDGEAYNVSKPKESYPADLIAQGGSQIAMLGAMGDFLGTIDEITSSGYYPANVYDVMTQAIVTAMGANVALIYQGNAQVYAARRLIDRASADLLELGMARVRSLSERIFPGTKVRHQSYESILCRWGSEAYQDRLAYGPYAPAVFMLDRTDEHKYGFKGWAEGLDQGVANDPKFYWYTKGSLAGLSASLNGWRGSDVLPKTGPYTITARLDTLPSFIDPDTGARKVILGTSQKNAAGWQIVTSVPGWVKIVIPTAQPNVSDVWEVPVDKVIQVCRGGDGTLQVTGKAMVTTPGLHNAGHLYLGNGTRLEPDGTRTPVEGVGIDCFKSIEIHHRALSLIEREKVADEGYPRGVD